MSAISMKWIERKSKQLSEDESWQLCCWAEEYFNGLAPAEGGAVWHHVSIMELQRTESYVAGNSIKPLAAQYIAFPPQLQDPMTDWLVADTLCFAEVNATLASFNMLKGGKNASSFSVMAAKAGWAIALWAAWLCVVVAGFYLHALLGWGLVAITAWSQFVKARAARKRARLAAEMMGTYQALSSSTFSWAILWEHMTDSRRLGAVWPPELYRLVELRMKR